MKVHFSKATGLSINQIQNWFINERKRQLPKIRAKKPPPETQECSIHIEKSNQLEGQRKSEFASLRTNSNMSSRCMENEPKEVILSLENQSGLQTTLTINHEKNLLSIQTPQFDAIDPSEAVHLDSDSNHQRRRLENKHYQQCFDLYMNNALRVLSQTKAGKNNQPDLDR
jgi:hypothetical protein